ncbi:hypothetical protein D3C80_1256260 [compost metagenome]
MLLRQILPERVLPAQHERHAKLDQQAKRADTLLAVKDKVAKIALAQNVQVVVERHLLRQHLQIAGTEQRQPGSADLFNISLVVGRIPHRQDHAHIRAKLLMNRFQCLNVPVGAIAGVTHQNGHRPGQIFFDADTGQCRIHPRREIQQGGRHACMPLLIVDHIATGSEYASDAALCNAAQ